MERLKGSHEPVYQRGFIVQRSGPRKGDWSRHSPGNVKKSSRHDICPRPKP